MSYPDPVTGLVSLSLALSSKQDVGIAFFWYRFLELKFLSSLTCLTQMSFTIIVYYRTNSMYWDR